MQLVKTVDSLADRLSPYAWRDDENSLRNKAGGNCYEWHASIAALFHPKVVLEIGVQRGYSVIAMLMGYPGIEHLHLIDNEADGYPLAEAINLIERAKIEVRSACALRGWRMDTQDVAALPIHPPVDLAHVDGRHTFEGASHDLSLVVPLVKVGGAIVIDDLWMPEVRAACDRFSSDHIDFDAVDIPSATQHRLFRRR